MKHDSENIEARKNWMAVLAKASWADLHTLWQKLPSKPDFEITRKPETGLVMVRGRIGGSGQPFNTGEATVTRCSVKTPDGINGHAYVLGRNKDHALAAAQIDAALQDETRHTTLLDQVINPLLEISDKKRTEHQRKTAATKVDFFTLVRGEND